MGVGRPVFHSVLMLASAILLSMSPVYAFVDSVLLGAGWANLILRALMFAIFLNLGWAIATAFDSMQSETLIKGRLGWWMLGLCMGALVVAFILGAQPGNVGRVLSLSNIVYVTSWRAYSVYVCFALLVALIPAIFRRPTLQKPSPLIRRLAAGFISACCFTLIASAAVAIEHATLGTPAIFSVALDFIAVTAMVSGLALTWWGYLMRQRVLTATIE